MPLQHLLNRRAGRMTPWLIVGNVLLVLTLIVMTVLSLRSHRLTEEERARDVVVNLAQSLAVEVGAELRNADNALATVALRYRSARSTDGHLETVVRILEEQRGLLPQVSGLRIADVRGQVIAGLEPGARAFNVSDRPYFAEAMMSTGMVVSEPLQSRSDGQWCVIAARRLINHDGQFAGVVYAVLSSNHFVRRFSSVALGPSGAVSLRSSALNLIARYSASEPTSTKGFGGKNVSEELKRSLAQNPEQGWYLTPTALDKVERITAYRKVPGYDMSVYTGMSSGYFLATWRQQVWQQSMLAAMVAALVAAASYLIHRTHGVEQRAREALGRVAREQELMLKNDLIGMVRVRDGRSMWGNPALERMFGYAPGELMGEEARRLFLTQQEHDYISAAATATIRSGGRFRTQLRMRRKDGSAFWVDVSGMVLSPHESLWMLVDIDSLKQSEQQAHNMALRDVLTNLPNRRLFEEKVADAINSARRSGQGFSVCYLDLDGFKPINDQHGHEAGDEVLIEVGKRLQQLVRGNDVVARLGGDEFALLLSGVRQAADVEEVLQRALFSIQRRITLDSGEIVAVNASVGAVIGHGGDDCRELLRAADEAMYAVKRAGKGRFQVTARHALWAAAA